MKLTEAQKLVLLCFAYHEPIFGREWFVKEREDDPHTIGVRKAFDWLAANGYIETVWQLTEAGRAALKQKDGGNG